MAKEEKNRRLMRRRLITVEFAIHYFFFSQLSPHARMYIRIELLIVAHFVRVMTLYYVIFFHTHTNDSFTHSPYSKKKSVIINEFYK